MSAASAAGPGSSRPRFAGGSEALADVVAPHATSISWLRYGEDLKTSKVNSDTILKHRVLVASLLKLMPTLAFKAADLRKCMTLVRGRMSSSWKGSPLKPSEEKDWDETMEKRLHVLLRHVAQARLANRLWATGLGAEKDDKADEGDKGDKGEEADGTAPAESVKEQAKGVAKQQAGKTATEDAWYGYDAELKAAWRQRGSSSGLPTIMVN